MMRTHFLRSIFLFVLVAISLPAQIKKAPPLPEPDQRYKTDILLIVAHPDDETAVASLLAKIIFDDKRKVAVVYCNRGSGGGNSYSREQSQALAAVREIEGRRSNAVLGIENVWFLDGLDTPSQSVFNSLQRWGHGKILEQIIRLIRLTRPEVIITWLPHYVAGENHGDHQAAGVIATEAFDWAADPTIFPAQMAMPREYYDISQFGEGLQAWQPKKIYYFSDASHPLDAIGPFFDVSEISPSKQA
ncbi:MAG: PIG-L family deacetylase, partial [Calditrichaeota bacterium]